MTLTVSASLNFMFKAPHLSHRSLSPAVKAISFLFPLALDLKVGGSNFFIMWHYQKTILGTPFKMC